MSSINGPVSTPVRYAELLAVALRHRQLRRNGWQSRHHGFWMPGPGAGEPLQRIADAAAVLPDGGAVGGWAAAYLHGVSLLNGQHWDGQALDVMVCVARHQQVRRAGIDDFRSALLPEDVIGIAGMPITSLVRTAFDLTRRASSLTDAVCALDAIGHATELSIGELAAYAEERSGWRGVRRTMAALELTDHRSLSLYESRLRLLWLLDGGLPALECNVPVFSPDGRLLGYPDLLEPFSGVVLEYDGAYHRVAEQQSADNIREEGFERHGLIVVRAGVRDLFADRAGTVGRMRAAYRDGVSRDRGRDRWVTTPPSWWTPPEWFRPAA